MKKQVRTSHVLLLVAAILMGVGLLVWNQYRMNTIHREEENAYSEEQAAERLQTLEEALCTATAEVVPMQFFEEEIRVDDGNFSLIAVTTMPEDDIEEAMEKIELRQNWINQVKKEARERGGGIRLSLKIIRNDITKVSADIIVNTANPNPTIGSGVDSAIYTAAGEKELLE